MNWWMIIIGAVLFIAGILVTFLQVGEREKINEEHHQIDPFYKDGMGMQRPVPAKVTSISEFIGRILSSVGGFLIFIAIVLGLLS